MMQPIAIMGESAEDSAEDSAEVTAGDSANPASWCYRLVGETGHHVATVVGRIAGNMRSSTPVCVASTPVCVAFAAVACGVCQATVLLHLLDCWFDEGGGWAWWLVPVDGLCGIIVMLDEATGCPSGIAYAFWFSRLLVKCVDDLHACGVAELVWICCVAVMSTILRYALPPDGTTHFPNSMLMLAY